MKYGHDHISGASVQSGGTRWTQILRLWSEDPVVYASSPPLVVGGFFVELSNDSCGEKSQVATTREPRPSTSNHVSRDVSAGGSDGSDQVSRRRHRQVEQASGVAREQGNIIR